MGLLRTGQFGGNGPFVAFQRRFDAAQCPLDPAEVEPCIRFGGRHERGLGEKALSGGQIAASEHVGSHRHRAV